jgi:hypothetical protein
MTTQYTIAHDRNTDTFTVVYDETRENLSHHESLAEARAAIRRYQAADKRRQELTPCQT